MEYIIAFLVGGAICAVVQVIMDNTKLLPGRIMVGLVCGGAIISFLAGMSRLLIGQNQELLYR